MGGRIYECLQRVVDNNPYLVRCSAKGYRGCGRDCMGGNCGGLSGGKPYKIAGGYGIDCIRCGAYGGGGGNCPGVEQA